MRFPAFLLLLCFAVLAQAQKDFQDLLNRTES